MGDARAVAFTIDVKRICSNVLFSAIVRHALYVCGNIFAARSLELLSLTRVSTHLTT
jgi:hypothetical protein